MELTGVTLVNMNMQIPGVGSYVTRSAYCTTCPPWFYS